MPTSDPATDFNLNYFNNSTDDDTELENDIYDGVPRMYKTMLRNEFLSKTKILSGTNTGNTVGGANLQMPPELIITPAKVSSYRYNLV